MLSIAICRDGYNSYTLNVTQLKKASVLLVYIHVVSLPGPRYMQGNEMKVHRNLAFNSHE